MGFCPVGFCPDTVLDMTVAATHSGCRVHSTFLPAFQSLPPEGARRGVHTYNQSYDVVHIFSRIQFFFLGGGGVDFYRPRARLTKVWLITISLT